MLFLLGKTCIITIPKSIDTKCFLFSSVLFHSFPSLSFIPLLSSQGFAHMMAEQGMPLFSSSLLCLCFVCDSSVELCDLVLVWNICESAWFYIHCDIQWDFIILLYCPTKPKHSNYTFCRNSVKTTTLLLRHLLDYIYVHIYIRICSMLYIKL